MTADDDSDIFSTESKDSSITHLNDGNSNQLQVKIHLLNEFVTAITMQMCAYLQYLIILSRTIPTLRQRRGKKRNHRGNIHRDRSSVMAFIRLWSDEMFKPQFRLCYPNFFLLEATILENMERKGYDYEKHVTYAT